MSENEALTPPLSTNQDDYSDLDSQNSQTSRRKYLRGGRKKSTGRQSRMPPLPQDPLMPPEEYDDPPEVNHSDQEPLPEQAEPKPAELEPAEPAKQEQQDVRPDVCPTCSAKSRTPSAESIKPSKEIPTPFQTGIRAFNMKRAAGSGGRPIGVRSTSGKKEKKSKSKESKKKKKKKGRKVESSEEETESEESEEEEEEKKQKPMSIRLDLNLVIEIFLKAKIQGDVTITFQ